MSQDKATPQDSHVQRAKQIADAIDSPDREATLYEQFYAEWKAWKGENQARTMRAFDEAIGRGDGYTGKIVRWIQASPPGESSTPFDRAANPHRGDGAAAARALADPKQRTNAAKHIADAMRDPEVRDAIAEHMADTPGAARDLGERAAEKASERRRPTERLGVPEPKASFLTHMAGPIIGLRDAWQRVEQVYKQHEDGAHEDEIESVREDIAAIAAAMTAFSTDWSIR